jgi:hypothetical protein
MSGEDGDRGLEDGSGERLGERARPKPGRGGEGDGCKFSQQVELVREVKKLGRLGVWALSDAGDRAMGDAGDRAINNFLTSQPVSSSGRWAMGGGLSALRKGRNGDVGGDAFVASFFAILRWAMVASFHDCPIWQSLRQSGEEFLRKLQHIVL